MRGIFFQCENCKARVFDEFPIEWMHIPIFALQVGKGYYNEKARDSYDNDYVNTNGYRSFKHLTFCSMVCFFEWFKNTYPDYQNPSQRI
jgi:hypothetical protein